MCSANEQHLHEYQVDTSVELCQRFRRSLLVSDSAGIVKETRRITGTASVDKSLLTSERLRCSRLLNMTGVWHLGAFLTLRTGV